MADPTKRSKGKSNQQYSRRNESEAQELISLFMIPIPNTQKNLSDTQQRNMGHDSSLSRELIYLLIEAIKSL